MIVARSNMHNINVLKIKLAKSFVMKDLGATKKILGMRIIRDRKICKLALSKGEYIENVLEILKQKNVKQFSAFLAIHFKMTKETCPEKKGEINYLSKVSYSSTVGS
jgi:hypothetical protein